MLKDLSEKQLDSCMHIFWYYGYFNAPIEALVQASGLNRAAIYKRFGGKDGLFLAMLDHYETTISGRFLAPLLDENAPSQRLQNFFQHMIHSLEEPTFRHGCFLIATASDLPAHTPAIQKKITSFILRLENLLTKAIRESMPDTANDTSVKKKADFLISNIFGLFTLLRATQDKARIQNHLEVLQETL